MFPVCSAACSVQHLVKPTCEKTYMVVQEKGLILRKPSSTYLAGKILSTLFRPYGYDKKGIIVIIIIYFGCKQGLSEKQT